MAIRWRVVAIIIALVFAGPAALVAPSRAAGTSGAQSTASSAQVDLALVFAVDTSLSIDEAEAGIQRKGYASALRDKRVIDAIHSGILGRIAVTYLEWSAPTDQRVLIGWRVISDDASAKAFADELEKAPYKSGTTTSISAGIDYAVRLLQDSGIAATRRVIDVSGDGYNDYGRPITVSRNDAVKAHITINGLPVMNERPKWKQAAPPDLDTYYRDNVIGGPGSFYLVAKNLEDFSQSVLHKLVLEIASLTPPASPKG